MKFRHTLLISLAVLFFGAPHARSGDTLQPPPTLRERCIAKKEWKRYGSIKQCIAEKRDEDLISVQKTELRLQEDRDAAAMRAAEAQADIEAEERKRIAGIRARQEEAASQRQQQQLSENLSDAFSTAIRGLSRQPAK